MARQNRIASIDSPGAVEHLLKNCPHRVLSLSISKGSKRLNAIRDLAAEHGIALQSLPPNRSQAEVSARVQPFEYTPWERFVKLDADKKHSTVLVLDHLQDPQNFGAICRTADGLGVDTIFIPKDRSVSVGPGVYNASVGAVETIPICRVTNLSNTLRDLKEMGYWILGASLEGETTPPWKVPDFEKIALVMGSEYEGLGEKITRQCDWLAHIPLGGKMPSLNVSVSAAILMYELGRRRKLADS